MFDSKALEPDVTDLDALSDELIGLVGKTVQPAHVSLWLRPHADRGSKVRAG